MRERIEHRAHRLQPDLGWHRVEPDPLYRWASPYVACRVDIAGDVCVGGSVRCESDEHGAPKWVGTAGDGRDQIYIQSRYIGPIYFDFVVAAVSGAVRAMVARMRLVPPEE